MAYLIIQFVFHYSFPVVVLLVSCKIFSVQSYHLSKLAQRAVARIWHGVYGVKQEVIIP